MKRYFAFAYRKHHALGGMNDFKDDFDDPDFAIIFLSRNFKDCDVLAVYDTKCKRYFWYKER